MEGLLAVVDLEVTKEGMRTGTGTERWKKRVTNFRGCNAKTAIAKIDVRTNGAESRNFVQNGSGVNALITSGYRPNANRKLEKNVTHALLSVNPSILHNLP